ncbi:hypothetical protein N7532_010770 [Penicillium argentinense]|uniref:HMG box domain-containing protein n=1 Tax=Penicillium argentinense TaxID=1131581 RepID=A0A9W9EQF0_9EURO|nr:uncharacterized protein N7532_010770 [Penicillium argentinense]KAJ5085999.1 hypothetical protein N7532_010770 [Penicillium argentinense]
MASEATVSVNVDELRASKDAILGRLMGLHTYIADLSKAYLDHANNVMNGESATIDLPAVPAALSGFNFDLGLHPTSPGAKSEAGGPKKRKRAPADPNAPKRALTPYFLYMQHNRKSIAADLGDNARPKEVADEGTRRWQKMSDSEREIYKQMYAENFEVYKKEMAAYKANKDAANDPAANQLQQDFAGAGNEHHSDDETSSSESEEDKRRKSESKKEVAESPAKQASPVKKRGGKKETAPAEPASAKATPADNKRKAKKRKSEA